MPGTDSYGQGIPYAKLSDAPNIESASSSLANAAAPKLVMVFANANARAATLTGPQAPTDGMTTWLQTERIFQVYCAGAWQTYSADTGTWTSWTPVWTSVNGTSTPALGNAAVNCAYKVRDKLCSVQCQIAFGTTSRFGSTDNWQFSLPPGLTARVPVAGAATLPAVMAVDAVNRCMGHATIGTAGANFYIVVDTPLVNGTQPTSTGEVDAATPWTWAAGSVLQWSGSFEVE